MFDVITFGSATRDVFLRSKAMELHKEHGIEEACFPFGAKIDIDDIDFETGGGATNNAVTFTRLIKGLVWFHRMLSLLSIHQYHIKSNLFFSIVIYL